MSADPTRPDSGDPPLAEPASLATGDTADVPLTPPAAPHVPPGLFHPAPRPGDLGRIAHYRILGLLGAGGMGLVFLARDPGLDRDLALKVMRPHLAADPVARARFLREARAAAAVKSDHLVTVYGVGESDAPIGRVVWLALELLEGESLEDRLKRSGRLQPTEIARLAWDASAGLGAAHAKGLVHRDVKPGNLWLEAPTGRTKVLDFGLARPAEGDDVSLPGTVVGTPAYMAPEQAVGGVIDHRADLFSLGCVLYRCAAGVGPFARGSSMATLQALATELPAHVSAHNPELPPGLADLIMALVEKDPDRRLQSAAVVMQTLAALAAPAAAVAPPPELTEFQFDPGPPMMPFEPTPTPLLPARPVLPAGPARAVGVPLAALIGGGGAMVFVLAGLLVWALTPRSRPRPPAATHTTRATEPARKPRTAGPRPVNENWLGQVRVMPGDQQLIAVRAKLIDLNLGYDGALKSNIVGGKLLGLDADGAAALTDITPLQGVSTLQSVGLRKTGVTDVSPLKGLLLESVTLPKGVTDLSPLAEAPLKRLEASHAEITTLEPLRSRPLVTLDVSLTQVADLSPLAGMKLRSLAFGGTRVADIAPLRGMPLETLLLEVTPVTDLSPLKGMANLRTLKVSRTGVRDLAPLAGLSLDALDLSGTPLAGAAGLRVLTRCTTLSLAGTTVSDLAPVAAVPGLIDLDLGHCPVRDLGPLARTGLTRLGLEACPATDLTPLKGLKLQTLDLTGAAVTDLSPLVGMPLEELRLAGSQPESLAVLARLPLVRVTGPFDPVRDRELLKSIPTLKSVNGKDALVFLGESPP
jgi:Leucine-rich repeat (LRR) protein